ncbi:MAG: hypothetical protein DWQ44_06770 [Bacteroidetes bacterium]|nr:MAG: hypothetical protein DWQ39_04410 [Bacteroidota bacterium]REK34600.1 MAG: hypothetical protein DWQ44_06770 [Bacteroidota bacterium]
MRSDKWLTFSLTFIIKVKIDILFLTCLKKSATYRQSKRHKSERQVTRKKLNENKFKNMDSSGNVYGV